MRPKKMQKLHPEYIQGNDSSLFDNLVEFAATNDGYSRLIEAMYYSFEDDLMTTIRLVAGLEPADREEIYELAKSIDDKRKAQLPTPDML